MSRKRKVATAITLEAGTPREPCPSHNHHKEPRQHVLDQQDRSWN